MREERLDSGVKTLVKTWREGKDERDDFFYKTDKSLKLIVISSSSFVRVRVIESKQY